MNTIDWKLKIREKEKEVYTAARNLLENAAKERIGRLYLSLGYDVELESIEENIALWMYSYIDIHNRDDKYVYLYTDLNGTPLFNGKLFRYATPFSGGKAIVFDFDRTNRPYFIDINSKEIINLPGEIGWRQISNFKNNRLYVKGNNEKWGSIHINGSEKIVELEIPFIWDFLAGSKHSGIVFPGRLVEYTTFPNYELGPYSHMVADKDKSITCQRIKLARMTTKEALTIKRFKEMESYFNEMEWRRGGITAYMPYFLGNPGDELFHELDKEELCLTDGSIINPGSLDQYKGVSYRLKK